MSPSFIDCASDWHVPAGRWGHGRLGLCGPFRVACPACLVVRLFPGAGIAGVAGTPDLRERPEQRETRGRLWRSCYWQLPCARPRLCASGFALTFNWKNTGLFLAHSLDSLSAKLMKCCILLALVAVASAEWYEPDSVVSASCTNTNQVSGLHKLLQILTTVFRQPVRHRILVQR
jgi:hypothetical protein